VVNSDFDLAYNAGTVLALDLDRIRAMVPPLWDTADPAYPCRQLGNNTLQVIYPGPCSPIDLNNPADGKGGLVGASTQIGAFATDLMVMPPRATETKARLFMPVRGDPSVTYIEVPDDRGGDVTRTMTCGQTPDSQRCSDAYRAGQDPSTNLRGAVLPPEPYGIAASDNGDALVVTHQTTGTLSLLTNPPGGIPTLQYVLSGVPYGAMEIASMPTPGFVKAMGFDYQAGFLATFRASAEVDLIRYYDDKAASPARPFISRTVRVPISVNSSGADSRGIAINGSERQQCEAACQGEIECLRECALIPLQVFIANRSPPSLIIGEVRSTVTDTWADDSLVLFDSVPVRWGPSRVSMGQVRDTDGKDHPRVFVACFDARTVFVYDPVNYRQDTEIRTGRGPHGFAFDPIAPYLYVVHFTDSYVGVVDLDRSHTTYGTIVASVGVPKAPRATK
jgi:DNA-binding beta-propeller fold protein YncE